MVELHIKCSGCGRNEKISEERANSLPWSEDESIKCDCNKRLPFKGHTELVSFGVAWLYDKK